MENETEISNNSNKKTIFTSEFKSLRLFSLKIAGKENNYKSSMLKLNPRMNGLALVPILKSVEEVCHSVKLLFGENYMRYWKRYLAPRKIIYKNQIGIQKRIMKIIDFSQMNGFVTSRLDRLPRGPSFRLSEGGATNAIFDLSEVFKLILPDPKNSKFFNMSVWKMRSDIVFPEIISSLLFDNQVGFNDSYLKEFSMTFPPLLQTKIFDTFIIPIKVNNKSVRNFKTYLKPTNIIPDQLKKNGEDIFLISLLRFLLMIYNPMALDAKKYPEMFSIAQTFYDKSFSFIFYNDISCFVIDFDEMRKNKVSTNMFLTRLLTRVELLIRMNNGESVPIEDSDEDGEELDNKVSKMQDDGILINSELKDFEKNNDVALDYNERIANLLSNQNKKNSIYKNNNTVINEIDTVEDVIDPNTNALPIEDDVDVSVDDEEGDEFVDIIDDDIDDGFKQEPKTAVDVIKTSNSPKLSPAQMRRISLIKDKYKSIQFDDNRTLEQILNDVESMTIESNVPEIKIRDESLKHSSLVDLETSYVKKTLDKDIVSMVKSFSDNKDLNIHITNFSQEDTSDQFNERRTLTFELEDDRHKKHKLRVQIPKIDSDGFMYINGNKKVLKKQWCMLPIVKFKPDTVLISSNLNKAMIFRQGNTINHNIIILKRIIYEHLSKNPKVRISTGDNMILNKKYITTIEYDDLASIYHQISIDVTQDFRIVFSFNQDELRKYIKEDEIDYKFSPNRFPYGIYKNKKEKKVLDIDLNDDNVGISTAILAILSESGVVDNFDKIVSSIPAPKRRVYSRIILLSKKTPLIAFLGGVFGLKAVIDKLNHPFITFSDTKIKTPNINNIKFSNGYLSYPTYPMGISLLLNGLSDMGTEDYKYEDFNENQPYMDYLYDHFQSRNIIKGWVTFKELFLDPITLEILKEYKLPTDFLEVFLYANDLLADNQFTHETDASIYRIRGFEVISVELFKALAEQYRNVKVGKAYESMSLPEDEVLKRLHKSFILENVDSLSPANELKTKSIVTFKGPGGINLAQAFPLSKRAYGRNMIGVIGLPSVDSSAVGIVKQTVINPRVTSTRGFLNVIESENDIKGLKYSEISTPETASLPFVDMLDDPKRQGFASGQTKHVIPVGGSVAPMVGTGFEQSIIYKIGDTFAKKSTHDGRIISIDEKNKIAVIEYSNGEKESFNFGLVLNRNSNMYLGNDLELAVKLGDKVKKGEVLTYNKEFFDRVGKSFIMKQGPLCRLVILEGESTEDDSSDLTQTFSEKLSTMVVKRKQISLESQTNLISYKKLNEEVVHGDALMTFEYVGDDTGFTTSVLDLLGDVDEHTLNSMTRFAPGASETGRIIDLKVYWSIPLEDMSPSLRSFVEEYIKSEKAIIKLEEEATGKKSRRRLNINPVTPYRNRINGAIISENGGVVIEYYIGGRHSMGAGDKISYYSSLKSIVAHIIPKEAEPYSEFGDTTVDATLGFMSIGKRMVSSIYLVGWMGKIIHDRGKQIAQSFINKSTTRVDAENAVYDLMMRMDSSKESYNANKYKEMFTSMNSSEFQEFMTRLKDDMDYNLFFEVDSMSKNRPNMDRIIQIAAHYKIPLVEYVTFPHKNPSDPSRPVVTMTRVPKLIIPVRRLQQMLDKKNSAISNTDHVNPITGQVTGESKAASLSDTQTYSLVTVGLKSSVKELLGPRADDQKSKIKFLEQIENYGRVSLDDLQMKTRNKQSINTMEVFFRGAGLKTDIMQLSRKQEAAKEESENK